MTEKDHLIKHGNIMVMATILSGVLNYTYHIVMVRMLGPGQYGILFPLFAMFMIVSLSTGPVQTVIAKYISGFKALNQKGRISYLILKFLWKMSIYCSLLLFVYLFMSRFIAAIFGLSVVTPVILIGFMLFIGLLFPVGFGAFQGLEMFAQLGSIQIAAAFLRVCFGIFFVWIGFGVNGALLGSLLAGICIFFIAIWILKDILSYRPFDREINKTDIYKYFVPVTIAYVCFAIITYVDPIVVRVCFGDKSLEVGYYSIVSMIGKAFLFVPMSVTTALFPKVSNLHEREKETRHLLNKALGYSCLVCFIGIFICVFFPKMIIYLLMKKYDITEDALLTMIPLFRLVGFAVMPYGLVSIIINYHLAKHEYGFIPFLVIGTILQIILFLLFHSSLMAVMFCLMSAGFFIFITCYLLPSFLIDKSAIRR